MSECYIRHHYRNDIDGLRAIAIIAVLLYHLIPSILCPSGFIGVDYFFTISGYLISRNIINDINHGSFSFIGFYYRRTQRILPAIIFLYFCVIIASAILLHPQDHLETSKSMFFSSIFLSNYYFYITTDYFNTLFRDHSLLLHTWSLSVEEQFYLLFPPILFFLYKINSTQKRLRILVAFTAGLFLLHVVTYYESFFLSFFSLHSRAWQFLIGTILAVIEQKAPPIKTTKMLQSVGITSLAMLIFGTFLFSSSTPSYLYTSFCCFIGVLIHIGKNTELISSKILSHPILGYVGKISYSLYLWHWVIIVFAKKCLFESNLSVNISIIFLSLFFAHISWKYIERPFRRYTLTRRSQIGRMMLTLTALLLVSLVCLLTIYSQNSSLVNFSKINAETKQLYERMIKTNPLIQNCMDQDIPSTIKTSCLFGKKERKDIDVFLIGDSHAAFASGFIESLLEESGLQGYMATVGGCFPSDEVTIVTLPTKSPNHTKDKCHQLVSFINKETTTSKNKLFVIALKYTLYANTFFPEKDKIYLMVDNNPKRNLHSFGLFKNQLTRLVTNIIKKGHRVILLSQIPEIETRKINMQCIKKALKNKQDYKCGAHYQTWEKKYSRIKSLLITLQKTFPNNLEIYDPDAYLCDKTKEKCTTILDNTIIYRDDNHLNPEGGKILFQHSQIQNLLTLIRSHLEVTTDSSNFPRN